MARQINRTCCICGEEYSYCPVCGEDMNKPTWYNSFDNENCKVIYEACAGFGMGHLTRKEAYEMLKDCDLSKKEKFTDSTKKFIEEIMKEAVIKPIQQTKMKPKNRVSK